MAIFTIKHDKFSELHHAKYRIVILGNLELHHWHKHECFAPILSQFEFRLLSSLAAHLNCIPKGGDVSQAFYQSFLPDNKINVSSLPNGCPTTPLKSYWHMMKTLYGLCRSPCHWYEKACTILTSIGLQQCPNTPCIFHRSIIKDKPPLYVEIYVNNFIYFSQSSSIEEDFALQFSTHVSKVTFNDKLD